MRCEVQLRRNFGQDVYCVVDVASARMVCYCIERDYAEIICNALSHEPSNATDGSITITQRAICDNCLGTGEKTQWQLHQERQKCVKCDGTGRI